LCHSKYEDGSLIPEQLIVDECKTFLFAGSDTGASTLSWIMYYLCLNPDKYYKLQMEVDKVLGDKPPNIENFKDLTYCEKVLKETLRIQPVVPWFDRISKNDCVLAGQKIYKGTTVLASPYLVHHDPDLWKEPENFIPERWDDPSSKKNFIWFAFSTGPRNCVGMRFAYQQIIITLSMLVQQFDIKMNQEKKKYFLVMMVLSHPLTWIYNSLQE